MSMTEDMEYAVALLRQGGCTAVACRGESVLTATRRGVKPLLDWLDAGTDLTGYAVADKVVGKGAAMLYCLLGTRRLHAAVISDAAAKTLLAAGITVTYDEAVPMIRNRAGDGRCPIESAVLTVDKPSEALPIIRCTLNKLQNHV